MVGCCFPLMTYRWGELRSRKLDARKGLTDPVDGAIATTDHDAESRSASCEREKHAKAWHRPALAQVKHLQRWQIPYHTLVSPNVHQAEPKKKERHAW
jgi:hypothetical protein